MDANNSPVDLDALEALERAATPGPQAPERRDDATRAAVLADLHALAERITDDLLTNYMGQKGDWLRLEQGNDGRLLSYSNRGAVKDVVLRHLLAGVARLLALAREAERLREENARLRAACEAAATSLESWERWEAGWIMDNECWAPDGMAAYPTLTETHYDALVSGLQQQRNVAKRAVRAALAPPAQPETE